jgi:WD40-like Beta Propeller Repeat
MLERIQNWMKRNNISPLLVMGLLNVIFIGAFLFILFLFITSRGNANPPLLTPQIIIAPNGDTPLPGVTSNAPPTENPGGFQVNVPTLTAGPSPTAPSNPFDVGGTIVVAMRRNARTHLYAITPGSTEITPLTSGAWDDRDPAWSPDGKTMAFSSNRSGSWDLYLLKIESGEVSRLTTTLGFEANPSWSPDGAYLTYEGYNSDNFDIYIVSVSGGLPIQVTRNPASDYAPVWSPNGRSIAFVSYRGGGVNPDLYTFNLDEPDESKSVRQITNTPDIAEDEPQWSKDGNLLLYADANSPLNLVYNKRVDSDSSPATEAAQGEFPIWTPDGSGIATIFNQNNTEFVAAAALGAWTGGPVARPVDGQVTSMTWSYAALPAPADLKGSIQEAVAAPSIPPWTEKISAPTNSDPPYTFITIPDLRAPVPAFSDRADDAFAALRLRVITEAGWDFLQLLDNATVKIDTQVDPGLPFENWNKAGRAFDLSQAAINDGWGVMMREEIGNRVYWHVWVRVFKGDGSLGEPLRRTPWDFRTRFQANNPAAFDAGGSYYPEIPKGFFIDFTTLADDYGWQRVPPTDNWRIFYPGVQYWHFEHRDGLDWASAMREVYSAAQVATATPFYTPTFTPSATVSPTITNTPPNTSTATRTATRTPSKTFTPTITNTPTTVVTRLGLPSATITPTFTDTNTPTFTATITPSRTPFPSKTSTPSRTPRPSATEVPQATATP